jgi:hypothetical protein
MVLAVPPLARTILDSLYTFVFLFEDLSSRADWYMRSGWRELFEYLERADRDYGSQPDWAEFLPPARDSLKKIGWMIGTPEDQLRNAEWWPTPPQMIAKIEQPQNAAFLAYLRDWYYREFSQISHGTLPGMIYTVGPLRDMEEGDTAKVEQMRGNHFLQVVMVLMALYSEIEADLKIGIATDLRYVWRVLQEYSPFAAEIYNRREYARRLA